VCPINEPEGCRQAGDCQPALERQAKELRRLCAEHERTIHELEVIVRELCLEISGLRQDIQAMRHQERPHFVIRYEDQSQFAPPYNMQRAQDASPIHLGQFVPFGFFVPVPPMRVVPTFMPYDPVTPYDCPGHSDPVQTPSKGIEE